ncbi:MAG: TonB-dependent receptor domain-containing protein [Vicingaceae bacterium]
MRLLFTFILSVIIFGAAAQSSVKGKLADDKGEVMPFVNVALYNSADSNMVKVGVTDVAGAFNIPDLKAGNYFLKATFVGLPDLVKSDIQLAENENKDFGAMAFEAQAAELQEFSVVEERVMVEVKPDRTVFNVQGTINSTGSDAISLLRKAPSVSVDNNDNVNVLGRSGVRVYIDGKQLPLSGDDLSNYLKNLPADQIDRIEIITNPGAKYEAEGNAGIVDIRLKKDKSVGANGSLSSTFTQGDLTRYNVNGTGNYRNKKMNVFGALGYGVNDNYHNIKSKDSQNNLYKREVNDTRNNRDGLNYRIGSDFFLHKNHTLGFLVSGRNMNGEEIAFNKVVIANVNTITTIDSILLAENTGETKRTNNTYNVNYRFYNKKGQSLNLDVDYGKYLTESERVQPNLYYNATEDVVLSEVTNSFDTPIDIEIYTAKLDYERSLGKSKLGVGGKFGQVNTHNTFLFYDDVNGVAIRNDVRSNIFDYDESVFAGYVSLSRPLGKKWNFVGGLRAEQTEATGDLVPFANALNEAPVELSYLSWFPSAGLTYKVSKMNSLAFNYGRRINRPDYNVLNPFRTQTSELSIGKGNPFLQPEIVNNFELGYTMAYKYNFKVAYSRTTDKITRLIGPDDIDSRATFVSWDNLATEEVYSFNASLPFKINKWWNVFMNLSATYLNNQADYGNGAVVDVQNFGYMTYQQHTFSLPKDFKAEVSGYYSGPGVWGGVFRYEANWSLNAGLSRDFLKKKLKARLAVNNIFRNVGWKGKSEFNGLKNVGSGRFDNQFVSFSLSYNFGNQKLKSRKRKTGLESESKRVGG